MKIKQTDLLVLSEEMTWRDFISELCGAEQGFLVDVSLFNSHQRVVRCGDRVFKIVRLSDPDAAPALTG
jgi:hypothetical protein